MFSWILAICLRACRRIVTVLFHRPGHLLVLASLLDLHLHQVPELWLEECRKSSSRLVCSCHMRVLRAPSHCFLVLSLLLSRHGSQIQSTIHQPGSALAVTTLGNRNCRATQDKYTSAIAGSRQEAPVPPDSLLWTANTRSSMYAPRKVSGTWQHGVSACNGVGFLGIQQLPPAHADVVGRFLLASQKERAADTACTFAVVTSQKSMHCTVMFFFCSVVTPAPRWPHTIFSKWLFVFLKPPSKRFF